MVFFSADTRYLVMHVDFVFFLFHCGDIYNEIESFICPPKKKNSEPPHSAIDVNNCRGFICEFLNYILRKSYVKHTYVNSHNLLVIFL